MCSVHLFDEVDVKVNDDVVEFDNLVGSINDLLFKLGELWNTFGVQFFQIVIFSESLKMSPYSSSIFAGKVLFYLLVHAVHLISKLLQLVVPVVLNFCNLFNFPVIVMFNLSELIFKLFANLVQLFFVCFLGQLIF